MHFEIIVIFLPDYKISDIVGEKPILARRHGHRIASGRRTQKPSSASPTQLNANNEQTSAATDAKVAIVLADRMTKIPCRKPSNSGQRSVPNDGENWLR
jgi:hypothetical protein